MDRSTRNEAIDRQIVDAIKGTGEVTDAHAEFDVDAIADKVLGNHADGYAQQVDTDTFWHIVAEHAR